ncbi:hypothetical protein EFV61_19025 [Yersinia enterocolitica]|nr:hypothetical protein [Yersinia enterocolitica]EKN4928566.1 hypothetical protein [Yersinia enterocolitica]EKN4930570.1 hypothetical protein [Yersinia enterocolitica]EKN5012725.1 hypothetical protein [Yersinia enterocolitica]EKN5027634.1 hypothetical protein [Yersinia enterocolitica]
MLNYPVILQVACALATLNNPNHLQHSKLIGIMSLIRGSPCGPAQALFKMTYSQFVSRLPPSCNSNYLGYLSPRVLEVAN